MQAITIGVLAGSAKSWLGASCSPHDEHLTVLWPHVDKLYQVSIFSHTNLILWSSISFVILTNWEDVGSLGFRV